MKLSNIDSGNAFDFGKTSHNYGKYRNIYPKSMYDKLIGFGVVAKSKKVLDLGSGTAILPINLAYTEASFTATDIAENQIKVGKQIVREQGLNNIDFKVCSAENTGFDDNGFDTVTAVQCFQYFNPEKAAEEIKRILKPKGKFCKIFMDWLPYEDNIVSEMEKLVLKYNPMWNGCGFEKFRYTYPKWAENRFNIETIHSYNESLNFTKEEWIGRIKTCRGVGASLGDKEVKEFENEYRSMIEKYDNLLSIKHQIHIEVYSVTK